MKISHALALLFVATLPAAAAAGSSKPGRAHAPETVRAAYYAHMPFRETPFADLEGIYPLTAEAAREHKHYRFVYDALDRVVEVSFRLGNDIQDLNLSRNALTFAPVTRVSYGPGRETRVFFDRHMNPTTSNGVYREEYELDEDGNRRLLSFFDVEGRRVASDWGVYEYRWSVDRRGTVTEQRVDSQGEPVSIRPHFPFYCLKLHYDQRGLLALMENYGFDCRSLTRNELNAAQDKLQYDANGAIYAWNVYDEHENRSVGNGPMVARGIMQRDALGRTVREYYEDADGEMMTNAYGWTDTYAAFDRHGNMIERSNRDAGGKLLNNARLGYARYTMDYDATGQHRVRLSYFDADGRPVHHRLRGYHSVVSDYDAEGNRVRNTFEDAAGQPIERQDTCAAVYEYEHDDRNRLVTMRLLDRTLAPARHCRDGWHETRYYYHPDGPLLHTETSETATGAH